VSTGPILLFGLPRSGTTWLGKIFDSHPDTLYKHEPESVARLSSIPIVPPLADAESYRSTIVDYVEQIPRLGEARVSAKLPLFPKSYLSSPRFALFRLSVLAAKAGARFRANLPVMGLPRTTGPGGPRLVWKSIASLGRLGVIAGVLDDSVGVQVIRHPCGFVASILRGEAQRRFTMERGRQADQGFIQLTLATPHAERWGLTAERLSELSPVEQFAWQWAAINAKAMDEVAASDRCHLIRYEDVCASPLDAGRRLFEMTGLGWQDQTESFVRESTAHDNPAYYSVYKDPMVAANRWKEELDPADIERILGAVADTPPGRLYAD